MAPSIALKPRSEAYEAELAPLSVNSTLKDFATVGEETPLVGGFFKVIPGTPLVFKYPYDEIKIILELQGDFIISDSEGTVLHPKPGDLVTLPKDCEATFSVEGPEGSYAYAFYVGKK